MPGGEDDVAAMRLREELETVCALAETLVKEGQREGRRRGESGAVQGPDQGGRVSRYRVGGDVQGGGLGHLLRRGGGGISRQRQTLSFTRR